MHINIVADMRRLIDEISNALNVGRWDITHEIAEVDGNTTTKPTLQENLTTKIRKKNKKKRKHNNIKKKNNNIK